MWYEYIIPHIKLFFLILVRIFGLFVVAPFLSSIMVPMRTKAILALGITFVIYPMLSKELAITIPSYTIDYILLLLNQFVIGVSIGFVVAIIFAAFQLSGQMFSIQMGLGIGEVFDPLSQIHVPLIGQFLAILGVLIFLLLNGHILMIEAVYMSFFKVPVLALTTAAKPLSKLMVEAFASMFVIALKIALPIIGTLFIVTLSMGLLAKFAPQMNILMLGFPLYIIVGLIVLILLMPFIVENGKSVMNNYLERIFYVF